MRFKMISVSLLTLIAVTVTKQTNAQDLGEMLRFNDVPNLNLALSESLLQSVADSVVYQSPPSARARTPFSTILFNGTLADNKLALQVSFEDREGQWSTWQTAYVKGFPNGRFWAKLDLKTGTTQRIKYRFLNRGVRAPARIEIYAVEALRLKDEEIDLQPAPVRPEKFGYFQQDTIPKPDFVTRAEWGATPPIGTYIPHDPYRFAQHHTAGRRVSTLAEGMAEQRFIQDFHQNGRGWQDIGYHFTVDDSGRVYEGVPPQFRGTHTGGANTGNIGISYMGNFEIDGEFPTQRTLASLVAMWSWLAFDFGVNPDSLFGHRDYKATACPGKNFYPTLPDLRNGTRNNLEFGAPYVAHPFPQPFTREISPDTPVQFFIRDDEEGVDVNTLVMRVNGETVVPGITGTPSEYHVEYTPPVPFPASQNVVVEVEATDLAASPNAMHYSYTFGIKVDALHTEVTSQSGMSNATLELLGDWQPDFGDVVLGDLAEGLRLLASDVDGSHIARVFPEVPETGDYEIYMASNNTFLGESARYRFVNANGATQPHFVEYNSVFLRKWGRLSPTPVHFDAQQPQAGYIELSGLADIPTRLILDALRFEKVDRLDPPAAPTLKSVQLLDRSSRRIEVSWYPTLEGDVKGYRLFMSEDGRTWGNALVDEQTLGRTANSYQINYSGTSTTVYFYAVAVDSNEIDVEGGAAEPLLSEQSDIYGVGLSGSSNILVVDNFDRLASWQRRYHPFVRSHGNALDANGFGFDSCTETAVQNGAINLQNYAAIIYFCGDDSRADESLAAADQFRLQNYLEAGGKLFISGSELGYDFDATTPLEEARYENLLKARYVGDLSGSSRVLGAAGTVFEGLDFTYGTMTSDELYFEDFPDYILPNGGSEVALNYDNLRIAAVQFTGKYGASNQDAQLIYLAFTFETIEDPDHRASLMGRVMEYFGLTTSVGYPNASVPINFDLQQNYPNPFNPTTNIGYAIATGSGDVHMRLEIYNTLGQSVTTLLDKRQAPGRYTVQWNGLDKRDARAASGVYIYRLTAGDRVLSRKMMLLK